MYPAGSLAWLLIRTSSFGPVWGPLRLPAAPAPRLPRFPPGRCWCTARFGGWLRRGCGSRRLSVWVPTPALVQS
jgi:hypothetical protein